MAGVSFSNCSKKALPYCLVNGLPFYEKWAYFLSKDLGLCVTSVSWGLILKVWQLLAVGHRWSTHTLGSQYPDTTVTAGTTAKDCPHPVSIIWSISLTKCNLWIRSQKPTLFSLQSKKPAEKVRSEYQPLSWSQPSSLTHSECRTETPHFSVSSALAKKCQRIHLGKSSGYSVHNQLCSFGAWHHCNPIMKLQLKEANLCSNYTLVWAERFLDGKRFSSGNLLFWLLYLLNKEQSAFTVNSCNRVEL